MSWLFGQNNLWKYAPPGILWNFCLCSKVQETQIETKAQFPSSGFKLFTVKYLMDWPNSVITWWAYVCFAHKVCMFAQQVAPPLPSSVSHCSGTVYMFRAIKLLGGKSVKATEQLSNLLLFSRQEKRRFSFPNLLMQKVLCMNVGGEWSVREQTHKQWCDQIGAANKQGPLGAGRVSCSIGVTKLH